MDYIIQSIIDNPIYMASNFIVIWLWFALMDLVLERKYSLSVVLISHLIVTPLYFVPYYLPYRSTLSLFILLFVLFSQVLLLYKDRFLRKFIVVVTDMMILLTTEGINVLLFYSPEFISGGGQSMPMSVQIKIYSVYLFINAGLVFIASVVLKRNKNRIYSLQNVIAAVIPFVIEIILLYIWFKGMNVVEDTGYSSVLVVLSVCLIGNAALFLSIKSIQERIELKTENDSLQIMIKAQEEYYSTLTAQYESIRKMRHDIENHLLTINILLDEGKSDEAIEYTKEISLTERPRFRFGICSNHIIEAYLNHRADAFQSKGIETEISINIPNSVDIKNSDLISVFGNMLDNAEDACVRSDKGL